MIISHPETLKIKTKNCYIFENLGRELKELIPNAHDGNISQIDWSHPEFENLLASGGLKDGKLKVWKYEDNSTWNCIKSFQLEPISALTFTPREYGLKIIVGDVHGNIYIISFKSKYIILPYSI